MDKSENPKKGSGPLPPCPVLPAATCYALTPHPLWKRILIRFFIGWHPPMPDLPPWAKDGLITCVSVNFCWRDRLRILLTGNVSVKSYTFCENPPGRVETQSSAIAPLENAEPETLTPHDRAKHECRKCPTRSCGWQRWRAMRRHRIGSLSSVHRLRR